jgi:hypothetical protein
MLFRPDSTGWIPNRRSYMQPDSALQKFKGYGCPNCKPLLEQLEAHDIIEDITSPSFEGLVALQKPRKSWVGRWQRIDGYQKGMYAVKVNGNVWSSQKAFFPLRPCVVRSLSLLLTFVFVAPRGNRERARK